MCSFPAPVPHGHVPEAYGGAIGIDAQQDALEFRNGRELFLRLDGDVHLLPVRMGLPPTSPSETCLFWAFTALITSDGVRLYERSFEGLSPDSHGIGRAEQGHFATPSTRLRGSRMVEPTKSHRSAALMESSDDTNAYI